MFEAQAPLQTTGGGKKDAVTFLQEKILVPFSGLNDTTKKLADAVKAGNTGVYNAATTAAVKVVQQFLTAWGKKNIPTNTDYLALAKAGATGTYGKATHAVFLLYINSVSTKK
jgi:hypothetical protein